MMLKFLLILPLIEGFNVQHSTTQFTHTKPNTTLSAKKAQPFTTSTISPTHILSLSLSILLTPSIALADGQTKEFKLPPIDKSDKARCQVREIEDSD